MTSPVSHNNGNSLWTSLRKAGEAVGEAFGFTVRLICSPFSSLYVRIAHVFKQALEKLNTDLAFQKSVEKKKEYYIPLIQMCSTGSGKNQHCLLIQELLGQLQTLRDYELESTGVKGAWGVLDDIECSLENASCLEPHQIADLIKLLPAIKFLPPSFVN